MEHYVILHNQVPRYVHRDLCYAAMAKYVALHNATYLAIATVFGPKNQELLMKRRLWNYFFQYTNDSPYSTIQIHPIKVDAA